MTFVSFCGVEIEGEELLISTIEIVSNHDNVVMVIAHNHP